MLARKHLNNITSAGADASVYSVDIARLKELRSVLRQTAQSRLKIKAGSSLPRLRATVNFGGGPLPRRGVTTLL